MLNSRQIMRIRNIRSCLCGFKSLENKPYSKAPSKETKISNPNPILGDMGKKFQVFREEDSKEILDVNEERFKYSELLEEQDVEALDPFEGLNLERGQTGVFEIEDLVEALKRENAEEIFVAAVPPEIKYVDYICVVTGKSTRHMRAILQFIRKVYKKKCHAYDYIPKVEGENSNDWLALDLGNIALHVFSKEARAIYDLESLWSVGPKYDSECNKQDEIAGMLEKHSIYLEDLKPAS